MNVDINKIKSKLLVKYPFFGTIVANLDYIEDPNLCDFNGNPTAGTDGQIVYYNPKFISNLTEEEQTFIFAHEVCHVAFDHIFRSEGKDQKLWNIATDAVINAFLQNDGLNMVKGGVDIPEAINYNAEEMYKKLLEQKNNNLNQGNNQKGNSENLANNQNQKQNNKGSQNDNSQTSDNNVSQNQSQSGTSSTSNNDNNSSENSTKESPGSESNNDIGHDTHSLWEKAIERRKSEEQKRQNDTKDKETILDKLFGRKKDKTSQESQNEEGTEKKEKEEIKKESQKISEIGEKNAFSQNKIEKKKRLEKLKKSLAKESAQAGTSTNSNYRLLGEIGTASPLIDWRFLLKEAIKIDIDWSYTNATVEDGIVTPHLEELPKPETEILLDTSGSIDEDLLRNFLRECKNILATSKVKVGCFDTKFYGFHEVRSLYDIDNMPFIGGGGTNFDAAVNAFSKRVENKIIFTDGCASMPSERLDAIWIVFGNKKINPPGGKVIYIDEEQLNKLSFYEEPSNKNGRTR